MVFHLSDKIVVEFRILFENRRTQNRKRQERKYALSINRKTVLKCVEIPDFVFLRKVFEKLRRISNIAVLTLKRKKQARNVGRVAGDFAKNKLRNQRSFRQKTHVALNETADFIFRRFLPADNFAEFRHEFLQNILINR